MDFLILFAAVAGGYLSGSISYATVIARRVSGKDIREIGSGNPGTLNVGSSLGKKWGVLVAILDGLKSFLPMLVASWLTSGKNEKIIFFAVMATGIAAIIGHWKPVFHAFRGGQCVGTAIGVFLFIIPLEFFISFVLGGTLIFFVMRRRTEQWVRWVPLTFILFVPIVAALFNALVNVPFYAHVSLGGHPWYWIGGIGIVCLLMLVINRSFVGKQIEETMEQLNRQNG